jgi:hydroxyethylthiazole kinase-like uncharacterized protein yjeF
VLRAYTAAQVRSAEEPLLAALGDGLMERAAFGLAMVVLRGLKQRHGRVRGSRVVLLVGAGNNGGDALHAGALLARRGASVLAVTVAARVHAGGRAALLRAGGRVVSVAEDGADEPVWLGDAVAEAFTADVVLDALVGIGGAGPLRDPAGQLVAVLSGLICAEEYGSPWVVAVDVPSGIGVDDGTVVGPVLPAGLTVAFGARKPGLLLPPARELAGHVQVVDIGLVPGLVGGGEPAVASLETADVAALWPVPGSRDDKYSRGVLGVVAGSERFPGAAVLATSAAVRAGAGMVRYLGPRSASQAVLAARPEVVTADGQVQAWLLGPGVDPLDREQADRVTRVLASALDGRPVPVVVDAGALELLPEMCAEHVVLTPHAGELARLLAARGRATERGAVEAEPLRFARLASRLTGATILLKGSTTIVVSPNGAVLAQGGAPAWLATAGAGDVLAGVLGALLAAHGPRVIAEPGLAARLAASAALVHGRAARRASAGCASRRGVSTWSSAVEVASAPLGPISALDVAEALPGTIAALLARPAR